MNPIMVPIDRRPHAWEVLAEGLTTRRAVSARYHGTSRLFCPHLLGWKNHRAKALSYQIGGTDPPGQPWRSMFVDEIEDAILVADQTWHTASNYAVRSSGIDVIELAVRHPEPPLK